MEETCKYIEISDKIKWDIFNGKFKENEAIPSVRKLAEYYEVNTATALRALHVLREQKIIYNNRTSRFYVCADISYLRQKYAKQEISNLLNDMVMMGYSRSDIQKLIREAVYM